MRIGQTRTDSHERPSDGGIHRGLASNGNTRGRAGRAGHAGHVEHVGHLALVPQVQRIRCRAVIILKEASRPIIWTLSEMKTRELLGPS